ncbi:MAG: twin-arginine translocase TatA/TatE family subunit [Anaerolineae bacterium]
MPTLSMPELMIILVIVLIVFGAGRLPQVGRSIGQGIREFRQGVKLLQEDEPQLAKKQNTKS